VTIVVTPGHFEHKPGLTRAPRAVQRHEAVRSRHLGERGELLLAANEGRSGRKHPAAGGRFGHGQCLEDAGMSTRLGRPRSIRAQPRRQAATRQVGPRPANVASVRIATWNVNSVKQRVPRLLPWLDERQPDVVCLQETKLSDDAFLDLLGDKLRERRYAVAVHGEATWNGVAILSRVGLDDMVAGLAGAPGFPRPESRAISATCAGIRVVSVYVPNGRVPGSEHYEYKLAWLASLREMLAACPEATVVCGDMNVAPTDDDVFDPEAYIGQTHVTPLERAALAQLRELGLRDVVRDRWPNERVLT
jgi:exodeoxyribonuclease III